MTNAAWKTIQVNQEPLSNQFSGNKLKNSGEHFIINEKDLGIYPHQDQLKTIDTQIHHPQEVDDEEEDQQFIQQNEYNGNEDEITQVDFQPNTEQKGAFQNRSSVDINHKIVNVIHQHI